MALVVAAALLGNDCVAAGFITFLAGEALLMAGNAVGLEASVLSYSWRHFPLGGRSSHPNAMRVELQDRYNIWSGNNQGYYRQRRRDQVDPAVLQ